MFTGILVLTGVLGCVGGLILLGLWRTLCILYVFRYTSSDRCVGLCWWSYTAGSVADTVYYICFQVY